MADVQTRRSKKRDIGFSRKLTVNFGPQSTHVSPTHPRTKPLHDSRGPGWDGMLRPTPSKITIATMPPFDLNLILTQKLDDFYTYLFLQIFVE